jgi:hypothetical protein
MPKTASSPSNVSQTSNRNPDTSTSDASDGTTYPPIPTKIECEPKPVPIVLGCPQMGDGIRIGGTKSTRIQRRLNRTYGQANGRKSFSFRSSMKLHSESNVWGKRKVDHQPHFEACKIRC